MDKRLILGMLDRPVAFHRIFVDLTGSVTAALFLSQALYWSGKGAGDDEFYKTMEEWQDETGLSRSEQESARRILRQKGVLEEQKKGIPAKVYYRINFDVFMESLEKVTGSLESRVPECLPPESLDVDLQQAGNVNLQETKDANLQQTGKANLPEIQQPCLQETRNLVRGKSATLCAENLQPNTETTTEITTETTTHPGEVIKSTGTENKPGVCVVDLIFSKAISDQEKIALTKILEGCDAAQPILDEIEGALANKTCKSILAFGLALHKAWSKGTFAPSLGVAVAKRREAGQLYSEALERKHLDLDPEACRKGQALLESVRKKNSSPDRNTPLTAESSSPGANLSANEG